jgi:hypothetical protein
MYYLFFDDINPRCFCKLMIDEDTVGFGFADCGFQRVVTSSDEDFQNLWPDDVEPIYDNGYLLGITIDEELPARRYMVAKKFVKKINVITIRNF